jgi:Rrf2 family iron-sulfur cluster assembly transcriptional regulator
MLSDTSRYALRALVCLSRTGGAKQRIQARELAGTVDVPEAYLAKVLGVLSRAKVVQGTRGVGGGYTLARSPKKIKLIQVVELFEGVRTRPLCFFGGDRRCSDDNACTGHSAWKIVWTTYTDFLERTSLAELGDPITEGDRTGVLDARAPRRRKK